MQSGLDVLSFSRPTACVSRWWAGRDSLREQKKLEARKMLENGAESHQSAARFVSPRLWKDSKPIRIVVLEIQLFFAVAHLCFQKDNPLSSR
jgi:hypothetical protein